jgi:prepilin-type N-terminal cleavage/methylation domain-containing protein
MRRSRLTDERGFTLPELLVAMFIGMIVLLAAFMVLDRSFTASGQIADRSDALQRGRLAMELITRQLRSQVCVGTTNPPVVAGTANSVTFYMDFGDGTEPIQRRTLTYNPTTDTITESVVNGVGTYPALTFTSPATTKPLLTKVEPILDGTLQRPIFRYYAYKAGGAPGELEPLGVPLTTTTRKRVSAMKIGFRSFADREFTDDANSVVLEDDVYVRVAVPTQLQGAPECI